MYGNLKLGLFIVATEGGWREGVGPMSTSGTIATAHSGTARQFLVGWRGGSVPYNIIRRFL